MNPASKTIKSRVSAQVQLDRRDADLLRHPIELAVQFGRAVARVRLPGGSQALHRIVAERHVARPSEHHDRVEARNGNKLDCRACNLVWVEPSGTHYQQQVRAGAPRGVRLKTGVAE